MTLPDDLTMPTWTPSICPRCLFVGTSRGFDWHDGARGGRTPGKDVYICPAHPVTLVETPAMPIPLRAAALVLRSPDPDLHGHVAEDIHALVSYGPTLAEALARAVEGDLDRIYEIEDADDEDEEDEDDG